MNPRLSMPTTTSVPWPTKGFASISMVIANPSRVPEQRGDVVEKGCRLWEIGTCLMCCLRSIVTYMVTENVRYAPVGSIKWLPTQRTEVVHRPLNRVSSAPLHTSPPDL